MNPRAVTTHQFEKPKKCDPAFCCTISVLVEIHRLGAVSSKALEDAGSLMRVSLVTSRDSGNRSVLPLVFFLPLTVVAEITALLCLHPPFPVINLSGEFICPCCFQQNKSHCNPPLIKELLIFTSLV